MPKNLLIATTNMGKQKEMVALLAHTRISLYTPRDLQLAIHVTEDGKTYAANALLKANAYCSASGMPALADDTGLEVDALGGAPGLYSARFSPKPDATDADRRQLLLSKLTGIPRPWKAHFTCTMALALPDGRTFTRSGICEGEISPVERGEAGFGYDQIFLVKEANLTMAELGMEKKNHISHRAHATHKILEILPDLLN